MTKHFYVFIAIFTLWTSGCAIFDDPKNPYADTQAGSVFAKGQTLVASGDFENALPYLNRTLEQHLDTTDPYSNYKKALLLSARSYDQLAQPEKALLALEELTKNALYDKTKELTIKSLLLKNKAKIQQDISQAEEKKDIIKAVSQGNLDKIFILDNLGWSLDFQCDKYCLEEVLFFKEIQLSLLYIVEQKKAAPIASEKAAELIRERYKYFYDHHLNTSFSAEYRKKLTVHILDSLRKLKNLDLSYPHSTHIYPSRQLIVSLEPIEKDLERNLYK